VVKCFDLSMTTCGAFFHGQNHCLSVLLEV
jgi:hypothetical protein